MAREINLVPDIKNEMIKALKLRNLIFFICIVVASASVAITAVFAVIAGGQQAVVNGKKGTIDNLSSKLNSYSDLSHFLTIKDQLSNVSSITDNKQVLSRTFGILSAIIPTGADTIKISELNINLAEDEPTFSFDAQADAGSEPFIDYNVLDSFKKSMQYMRYDYGEYIDKYGNAIPSYCMIEHGNDGASLYDASNKSYYAYWLITGEGCDPTLDRSAADDEEESLLETTDTTTTNDSNTTDTTTTNTTDTTTTDATNAAKASSINDYTTENYNGQTVVKIWRTPQFSAWYKEDPKEGEPYMDTDGNISNVAHFESACIKYTGTETSDNKITWSSTNDSCLLVPNGSDGIVISDSSNGRSASSELVLRFSATITFNPEVFKYNNTHMLAIPPSGRYNVTDSYVQIQSMFTERATDCDEGDTECKTTTGGNN
ncbi:hypothetical protein IKF86_00950 [Candidatus Saccharibacteria bacterium]|nr:hypothetical protein [Candidatus Saccharibacteria bacterium]